MSRSSKEISGFGTWLLIPLATEAGELRQNNEVRDKAEA